MKRSGGLIVQKQEMTRLWVEGKQIPVTLVKICDQEIIRYKTTEKDGYDAVVIGIEKQELKKDKGQRVRYAYITELHVDASFVESYTTGSKIDVSLLDGVEKVSVVGISKGKGFQGVIKRHHFAGGPATHGSKFHRAGGSTGNRKPRRTIRGWKMAGRMGGDRTTLRSVSVLDVWHHEGATILAMKGSLPGARNSYLTLICN